MSSREPRVYTLPLSPSPGVIGVAACPAFCTGIGGSKLRSLCSHSKLITPEPCPQLSLVPFRLCSLRTGPSSQLCPSLSLTCVCELHRGKTELYSDPKIARQSYFWRPKDKTNSKNKFFFPKKFRIKLKPDVYHHTRTWKLSTDQRHQGSSGSHLRASLLQKTDPCVSNHCLPTHSFSSAASTAVSLGNQSSSCVQGSSLSLLTHQYHRQAACFLPRWKQLLLGGGVHKGGNIKHHHLGSETLRSVGHSSFIFFFIFLFHFLR